MPVPLPKPYVPKYGDLVRYIRKQRTLPIPEFCGIMEKWAWSWMRPLSTDTEYDKERCKEFKEHWRYVSSQPHGNRVSTVS